ncbi:1-aminocyclopropane-1-carboxylate oxidase 4 [Gastrolobium bilobum]|uniref:1-aminocyclopropane-1-carboxylate oxidase 4 n=1 Tax=Gastrolobium bilobum TaxID=150636 RepID=UPI002AB2C695|nr:1-aminocyclopropane-1-carboxylate oxidase 4 [Gastrolobium bilobum]
MPEMAIDFRAPPPSPVGSGRRSSVTNDDVLTEFLDTSLRVPDLVLPDKIFPKQKHLETPPKVDFVSLCFHHDDALRDVVSESMARIGCFQLINHGIPKELISSAAEAAVGIFRMPPGKRSAVTRSPDKPWGFEEYHAGEEEDQGSELSEEFVWCNDAELKLKMEGISPTQYPNFSEKMETLMSRIEMVAKEILPVILKNVQRNFACDADADMTHHGHDLGTLCCVYKHRPADSSIDRWVNCLNYDVIRMLIKGADYSHSLCLHVCDGSSEFHLYSKKSWLSFCPEEGALIITCGDQIQILSVGHYKHVTGRPIFKSEKEDNISMAFLYSTQNTKNNFQTNRGRTISIVQQAIFAIILTLMYHVLIYVYKKL